jgi:3-dehydroquinate dehydratase-2
MSKKILIIHGPNLNLLGKRQVEVYGKTTLEDINKAASKLAAELGCGLDAVQLNGEGEIIEAIQKAKENYGAIIINPGAFTHYSIAIRDAISASGIPAFEVHLSNISSREEFRHHSVIAPVAEGQISGLGIESYLAAVRASAPIVNPKSK